jgi:hypothetical protein
VLAQGVTAVPLNPNLSSSMLGDIVFAKKQWLESVNFDGEMQ